MKLRHLSSCIAISIISLLPSITTAEDTIMLQGFDPLQAGPIAYAEAKKSLNATSYADVLFHHAGDPEGGNPNGKLILVEFFDYRCSHCMAMSPVINNLINKNPDVRIIYKEFPIRGNLSVFAAKAALAANNQGKYLEFHAALMSTDNLDDNKVMNLAKSLGMNISKLESDMKSTAIAEQISENNQLGRSLGIEGTPTFYITQSKKEYPIFVISGEVEQPYLEKFIAKLDH